MAKDNKLKLCFVQTRDILHARTDREPPSFCERTIRVLLNTANGCLQTPFKTSDRCSDHNTVVHFQLRCVYYLGV